MRFLPAYFRPQFQKHAGEVCAGVEIVVTDADRFAAYRCGVELLAAVHESFPGSFDWRADPYEFVGDVPAIDLLTGGPELRTVLESGDGPGGWIASWSADEEAFRSERREILLY